MWPFTKQPLLGFDAGFRNKWNGWEGPEYNFYAKMPAEYPYGGGSSLMFPCLPCAPLPPSSSLASLASQSCLYHDLLGYMTILEHTDPSRTRTSAVMRATLLVTRETRKQLKRYYSI